jgi:NADPH:quinone reductase-like Zn-dependent oxidoreductase
MDFEVRRSDLHQSRIVDQAPPDLAPGEALLRVDAFALTANNVTYGVAGDALRYWDFFPPEDDEWGRIPVWGFADVVATTHDGVAEGTRVYGYYPMSTHLVVTPGRVEPLSFTDVAPRRASLPGAYNQYQRLDADPTHDPAHDDYRMLLWPLFFTSFVIDDFLEDNAFFGAATVIVSSASSKTAIGTAFQLEQHKTVDVIGLTSERNVDFVESLGVYNRVVLYGDVDGLDQAQAVYVDVAGDASVRSAVHRAFGDRLAYSMMVGVTHWDEPAAAPDDLPGPAPSFFFAPTQISKRSKDWGRAGLRDRVASAWGRFAGFCDGWVRIQHGHGPEAVEQVYLEVLEGRSDPTVGHILSMWPERAR